MRISRHALGRLTRVAYAVMPLFFIFWIASIVRPQSPFFVIGRPRIHLPALPEVRQRACPGMVPRDVHGATLEVMRVPV